MSRPTNLADILEVTADAVPDRPAFISEHGETSYARLDERSTRLANHLVNGVSGGATTWPCMP